MAYRRSRTKTRRTSSTRVRARTSTRRGSTGRKSIRRASPQTVRIVIEQPAQSAVARPLDARTALTQTPGGNPQKAKF